MQFLKAQWISPDNIDIKILIVTYICLVSKVIKLNRCFGKSSKNYYQFAASHNINLCLKVKIKTKPLYKLFELMTPINF